MSREILVRIKCDYCEKDPKTNQIVNQCQETLLLEGYPSVGYDYPDCPTVDVDHDPLPEGWVKGKSGIGDFCPKHNPKK